MATAICQICQQEFDRTGRGPAKYCGDECYKEARRRQSHTLEQRDRKAKNKADQRKRNPERNGEICRQYRERHPDRVRVRNRKWHEEHPEYVKEQSRRYREKNPDRSQEHAQYYQTHREQVSARVKAYRQANPLFQKDKNSRRRARLAGAGGIWTKKEFLELCEQVDWHCAYCHSKFDKLTPDHILPLSRGGSNDISNIIPACGPCNYSKQDKTPLEYLTKFRI